MIKKTLILMILILSFFSYSFASDITQEEDYVVSNGIGIDSKKTEFGYQEVLTCGQDILNLTNNTYDCRIYYTAENSKGFFGFPIKTFTLESDQFLMKNWINISSNEYLSCITNSNKCLLFNQDTKQISDYTIPSIATSNIVKIGDQLVYIDSLGKLNINSNITATSTNPVLMYLNDFLIIEETGVGSSHLKIYDRKSLNSLYNIFNLSTLIPASNFIYKNNKLYLLYKPHNYPNIQNVQGEKDSILVIDTTVIKNAPGYNLSDFDSDSFLSYMSNSSWTKSIEFDNSITSNIGYYEQNNEPYLLLFYGDKSYKYSINSEAIINLGQKIKNISYVNTNDSVFFPVDRGNNKIEVVIFDKKLVSPSSYTGCNKPNIKIGGQEFSSCDYDSIVSSGGGGSSGGGSGGGVSNPCQDGYALPTQTQINNLIAVAGGTSSDYQNKCFKIETSPSSSNPSQEQTKDTKELINGTCGTDNNKILDTRPYNYCSTGFLGTISVTDSGYSWTCEGKNGGQNQNCSSSKKIDALCGDDNKQVLTQQPVNLCSKGTFSSLTYEESSNSWIWGCNGINEGNSTTCYAKKNDINGQCGTSNNSSFESSPSINLCSAGVPSLVNSSGMNYTWTCSGLSTNRSCSASKTSVNGVCGTAVNSEPIYNFSFLQSSLCSKGSYNSLQENSNTFSYSCLGLNNGTNRTCYVSKKVDGVCGSSRNGTSFYAPTTNLCSKGESSLVLGNGPFYWTCSGENQGTEATCFSDKSLAPNYTISGKITNYGSSYGREGVSVNVCGKSVTTNFLGEYSVEVMGGTSCSDSSLGTRGAVCSFSSSVPSTLESNKTLNGTCQTRYTFNFGSSASGAVIKWCSSSLMSQRVINLNEQGIGYWTRDSSSCSDSNYLTITKNDSICQKDYFNSSTNTYNGNCRALNNYIVDGTITLIDNTGGNNINPSGKTLQVCGNTVSLNGGGAYSVSIKEGKNCSNIYLNDSNYNCTFSGSKPSSLASNITINGTCEYIEPVSYIMTEEEKCHSKGFSWMWLNNAYACKNMNYNDSYSCTNDYGWNCRSGDCSLTWEYDYMMGGGLGNCIVHFTEPEINYIISGNVGTQANGANISLCGYSSTVSSDGSFYITVPKGSNCSGGTLTKLNHNCSLTQSGPSYLSSNYASVSGSCVEKNWYTVSFDLGLEGSGASVSACGQGYNTLDETGKYSFNVLEGTNCQNGGLSVTKPNYKIENLTALSSLPTSISSNVSITGQARPLNNYTISIDLGGGGAGAYATVCGQSNTLDETGKYSFSVLEGTNCQNGGLTISKPNYKIENLTTLSSLPTSISSKVSITGQARPYNYYSISGNVSNGGGGTVTIYGKTVNISEDGSYTISNILEDSTSTINSSTAYITKSNYACSFSDYGSIPSVMTQNANSINGTCSLNENKQLSGSIYNYDWKEVYVSVCGKQPYIKVSSQSSVEYSLTLTSNEYNNCINPSGSPAYLYDRYGNSIYDAISVMYQNGINYDIAIHFGGGSGW